MADTIAARKLAFLQAQARHLASPLDVPDASEWRTIRRRRASDSDDDDDDQVGPADLPEAVVSQVLRTVNDRLRRHAAAVYPPAALAHVASQIDALREHAASSALPDEPARHLPSFAADVPGVRPDGSVERGADLSEAAIIAALPDAWPTESAQGTDRAARRKQSTATAAAPPRVSALEAFAAEQEYAAKLRQLQDLQAERDTCRLRLAQLTQLNGLLAPLKDPSVHVQPNLVGRDGQVGAELERMKILLEQAAAKVRSW